MSFGCPSKPAPSPPSGPADKPNPVTEVLVDEPGDTDPEPSPARDAGEHRDTATPQVNPEPAPPRPPPVSRITEIGGYFADSGRACDGFPALQLQTSDGLCLGLAAHKGTPGIAGSRGRFRPRTIVQDPQRDDVFWVTDAGAKRPKAGRVWRLVTGEDGVKATAVLSKLDRPHGSGIGPDGKIYVGEIHRIFRFAPGAASISESVEAVVVDLPTQLRGKDRIRYHPLKSFVFAANWDLVVNMGSHTDRCKESLPAARCEDETDHTAALWRFAHKGGAVWSKTPTFPAHGLRNSVALAAHPSGTVLQGENGSDFSAPDEPEEELNVIRDGRHYGWPYCHGRTKRDPIWAHSDFLCDPGQNPDYEPPLMLLPAHAAPLDLLYYGADGIEALRGSVLVTYHGYRATGHRVVRIAVDDKGVPRPGVKPVEVVAGWAASETGPKGGPVGMTRARDGSVWIVDDRNGSVLRLDQDEFAALRGPGSGGPSGQPTHKADATFSTLHTQVLAPRCKKCHVFFQGSADAALSALHREGWLTRDEGSSRMRRALSPEAERPMPPDGSLPEEERAKILTWLRAQAGGPQ